MKKFILVLFVLMASAFAANAQKAVWAERIAGTGDDRGESIAVDSQGNTYVAGIFTSDTLFFNNGVFLTHSGNGDAYIAKYNHSGICQWAEKIAGTGYDQATSIAIDASGNVYVAGNFESWALTLNNGKTLINSGSTDAFIAKYNNQGVCQWAEKIAGSLSDIANSIAVDASGNVYVAGYFGSATLTLNNGKTLTNSGSTDAFIAKYNNQGVCQWAEKIAGASSDYASSLSVDTNGNVYVAGHFGSTTITFNSGKTLTNNSGNNNIFIAKYNNQGVCQWAEIIAGSSFDYANSITVDANGNVYVAGYFGSANLTFNNGKTLTNNSGNYNIFIAKYNNQGVCQWAEIIAGSSFDNANSITVDANGNVYIAGYFTSSTLSFNNWQTLTNSGGSDGFLAKYNSAGNCQWAEKIAGTSEEWVNSIKVDNNDFVYLIGFYYSTILNFNNGKSLNNVSSYDAFLTKYTPNQNLLSPFNNETGMPLSGNILKVSPLKNIINYRYQFSTNEYFATTIIDTVLADTTLLLPNLNNLTTYYWRAKAYWANDTTDWSDTWKFTTISSQPKKFVKFNASGQNTGTSWANAFNILQNAIDVAQPGDTIFVAQGTYKPTLKIDGNTDRHKAFQMKHGVVILGGFNGTESYSWQRNPALNTTILSGDIGIAGDSTDNCYHIFNTPSFVQLDTNAKLDGFILTKGYVNEFNPDNKGAAMIFNNNGSPMIRNCKFIQNRTTYRGGAIYNGETSPWFVNCVFEDNTSNNEGGAVYNYYAHNTKFIGSTFNYNRSFNSSGGAVYSHLTENELFDDCDLNNNIANNSGGALYVAGIINNCVFNNNRNLGASSSNKFGGAVYTYSNSSINNSTFTGNYNSSSNSGLGGAVYTFSNSIIYNCTFTGNYNFGSGYGGAIYTFSNSSINNCTFTGNYNYNSSSYSSGYGGAVYTSSNSSINNCTFTANYTSGYDSYGGAIYLYPYSLSSIANCKIENNYCSGTNSKGGGVYSESNLTLSNTQIYSNSATFGGGVYKTESSPLNAINSTITNNSSSKGGGLYVVGIGTSTLKNTIIHGNIGTIDGSNIYKESGTLNIHNSCYGNGNGDIFGQINNSSNNINTNPMFVDSENGDFRIYGISPCVDAGDNTATNELYDIRGEGFPRKLNGSNGQAGTVDIGAYEYKFGFDPPTAPQIAAPLLISPLNLAGSVNTSALFNWHSVSGALEYKIQVSTHPSFNILFANQIEVDTFAVITDLQPYTTYYWRVHSRNVTDSSLWSEVRSFVTMMATPIQVSPANMSQNNTLNPALLWNPSINATSYRVQVSTNSSFTDLLKNEVLVQLNTSISNLNFNTTYFWRVKALAANDSSGWSTVWQFTTIPAPLPISWSFTSNTGNYATIGVLPTGHYKIGNRTLTNGDAIGVFFTDGTVEKCGGYMIWDGQNYGIVAWGDDDYTTNIKEGFSGNEAFIFKIWDSQAQMTYNATAKFSFGPSAYQVNGISIVDTVTAITSITQNIPLTSGWNMISSYVTPDNPQMSSIVSPLSTNMQFIKNAFGQLYAPPFQTSLNTWNIAHAYQIRMNAQAVLPLTGIKITPETTPINFSGIGTYWIPYYRSSNMPTATALATISGKYLQIKNMYGQVYQPPFFFTLQNLQPNDGYTIRMTQSGTLTYPANAVIKSAGSGSGTIEEPSIFSRERNITGKTAVIAMDLQNVEYGDEIGVFTSGGMLVGSSVWQEGMRGVVVWGDDEFTNEKDGASEGEELVVKIWSKATKNIGNVSQISLSDMANNAQSFKLTYETDAVHLLKGSAEYAENTKLSISPQPASDELYIKLSETSDVPANVKLYNQAGQLAIDTELQANGNVIKLNTSTLTSGVYQMVININGKTYSEKVVVVK